MPSPSTISRQATSRRSKPSTYEIVFKASRIFIPRARRHAAPARSLALGEMSIPLRHGLCRRWTDEIRRRPISPGRVSLRPTRAKRRSASVFEFAEWDCDIDVALAGGTVGMDEDLPMQPVPSTLSILEEEAQALPGKRNRAPPARATRNAAVAAAQTASTSLQMAPSTARVSPENPRTFPPIGIGGTGCRPAGRFRRNPDHSRRSRSGRPA
ncbi:hypothetical protein F2981_09070 [Sinorhizobium meliloti]|nr:hypothetical protein [Sinorhizobium meliloti]